MICSRCAGFGTIIRFCGEELCSRCDGRGLEPRLVPQVRTSLQFENAMSAAVRALTVEKESA